MLISLISFSVFVIPYLFFAEQVDKSKRSIFSRCNYGSGFNPFLVGNGCDLESCWENQEN